MARNTASKTAAAPVAPQEKKATIIADMSMKEFAKEFNIIKASPVRLSSNGYPFITFLQEEKDKATGKNIAENVYFSKEAAKLVKEGDEPTVCKALGLKVLELEFEDGETRLKLSLEGGGGEYTSIEDLF